MIHLELPHLSVITKMDLLPQDAASDDKYAKFFDSDVPTLVAEMQHSTPTRLQKMNTALAQLIEDYNMMNYIPLNVNDEDSLSLLLQQIDNAIQYGEDEEPREPNDDISGVLDE